MYRHVFELKQCNIYEKKRDPHSLDGYATKYDVMLNVTYVELMVISHNIGKRRPQHRVYGF